MTSSLDAIVNDGTGNSVTLTITPSTDPNYTQTRINYRLLNEFSVWSDGGVYVGAAGVQGTVQVSGLTNNRLYEFIVYAELVSNNSPPSISRQVFCTSHTQPIIERITENIKASLEMIQVSNGYLLDIVKVERIRQSGVQELKEFPSIVVGIDRKSGDDSHPISAQTNRLRIDIEGWVKNEEDIDVELSKMESDIEQAMFVDHRRGDQAVTTHLEQTERFSSEAIKPFAFVRFRADIQYRNLIGNPFQRV